MYYGFHAKLPANQMNVVFFLEGVSVIYLKNIAMASVMLASMMTLSVEASSKKSPSKPAAQPKPQPKPKYVVPSKPGPINFVTPGQGERTHPRLPRGTRR